MPWYTYMYVQSGTVQGYSHSPRIVPRKYKYERGGTLDIQYCGSYSKNPRFTKYMQQQHIIAKLKKFLRVACTAEELQKWLHFLEISTQPLYMYTHSESFHCNNIILVTLTLSLVKMAVCVTTSLGTSMAMTLLSVLRWYTVGEKDPPQTSHSPAGSTATQPTQ